MRSSYTLTSAAAAAFVPCASAEASWPGITPTILPVVITMGVIGGLAFACVIGFILYKICASCRAPKSPKSQLSARGQAASGQTPGKGAQQQEEWPESRGALDPRPDMVPPGRALPAQLPQLQLPDPQPEPAAPRHAPLLPDPDPEPEPPARSPLAAGAPSYGASTYGASTTYGGGVYAPSSAAHGASPYGAPSLAPSAYGAAGHAAPSTYGAASSTFGAPTHGAGSLAQPWQPRLADPLGAARPGVSRDPLAELRPGF